MNLSFQWSSTPDNVKKVIIEKLSLLDKVVSSEAQLEVICKSSLKTGLHTITLIVQDLGNSYTSKKSNQHIITAFDDALHALRREIVRHKAKVSDNHRQFARNIKHILTHN